MENDVNYRKFEVFFADDMSQNVQNLLDAIQRSGLIMETEGEKEGESVILNLPDNEEHYAHNAKLLQGDKCLIKLDYSTMINDSIKKVKMKNGGYDLVVCDLYFGDNDQEYAESKIGGIWPLYWAMHLAKGRKVVCKLYSGQLTTVVNHIDYKRAFEFLQEAHHITIQEVEKSQDANSWREHLQNYFEDVRKNVITDIELDDRVNFINYLTAHLRHEHFNNNVVKNKFNDFKNDVLALEEITFNLVDRRKMKLVHLFPMVLGSHFATNDNRSFRNMNENDLERTLYKNELTFNTREKRDQELTRLRSEGIECKDFRRHDETGRPVYGIQFTRGKYDVGIISYIENSFIQSLDSTFQIHKFYTSQKGFGYWSSTSPNSPLGHQEFDRIRQENIIPSFEKIRNCFRMSCPKSSKFGEPLAEQIELALKNISESHFWKPFPEEQKLDHFFRKLEKQTLFNEETRDAIIPTTALFRVNVLSLLKTTLNFREGSNYADYENDEYQRLEISKFYWYCNAYLVRKGLRDIAENMQGEEKVFYLLETRYKECKALIKYKIVLRDFGRGIPSIIRKFGSTNDKNFVFDQCLRGFCELTIRSKMANFEGIKFDVFHGQDELPCPQIKETGTEFEILFTQGRERSD